MSLVVLESGVLQEVDQRGVIPQSLLDVRANAPVVDELLPLRAVHGRYDVAGSVARPDYGG